MGIQELTIDWKRIPTLMEDGNARNGDLDTSFVAQTDDHLANDGLIPQLFTSVPSLNHAASYLAQTTSLFTSCFSDYSVDSGSADLENSSSDEREMMTDSFKEAVGLQLVVNDCQASRIIQSNLSDLPGSSTSASVVINEKTRTRFKKSSTNAGALVESTNSAGNGISIFQGFYFSTEGIYIFLIQYVAVNDFGDDEHEKVVFSLIERTRRTLRGSADDIGWLQRCSGMPPVEDGTERFMEILENIRHGIHNLPNTVVYLFIPGLFSNHGPLYFINTKLSFSKMGLACHIAKIHSEASVEKNARELKEYIEEIYWGSRKRVLLLGHSKGGVDAAAALSLYWSDLKDKVAGLALAQSPYGGSPIASDILREGQLGDYVNVRKIMEILICKVIKGDMQALEDLTYEKRKKFLMTYLLPEELPVVSFHTEASISPAVLATLSRVAHAELPLAPRSIGQPAKLPVIVPLGATMAACAQLLQARYGEKSDGLVTRRDAEVPGSVVVRPKRKLDHGWMVYSDLNDDPSEANASQVCEALLTLLVEVGQKKRPEMGIQKEEEQ